MNEEHDARMAYETQIRDDVEDRWSELNKTQDESLRSVKDLQKVRMLILYRPITCVFL